jgi:hypothetical protein
MSTKGVRLKVKKANLQDHGLGNTDVKNISDIILGRTLLYKIGTFGGGVEKKAGSPYWSGAVVALLFHAVLFYFAIGPFNLYIDSAGYLYTADNILDSGKFVFNPKRPVGLPLFYYVLLTLGQYKIAFLVIFQIVCFYASVVLSLRILLAKRSWTTCLWLTLVVVLLSSRTFLYSYMILSEGLFSSLILLFSALVLGYAQKADTHSKQKRLHLIFFCALAATWIKSVGILFLGASFFLYFYHFLFVERRISSWLMPVIFLAVALLINEQTLGTWKFSKQDGIQLLISANKYINYDTEYMAHEKRLIRESHQEILRRFAPRTRLDQMIGPVEGIQTPAQILMNESKDYDDFNNKVNNIVVEGLMADGDWYRYAWDGLRELYKMLAGDVQEGLIRPLIIEDYNASTLNTLPFLQRHNLADRHDKGSFAWDYYVNVLSVFLSPKCLSFIVLACAHVVARLSLKKDRRAVIFYPSLLVIFVCLADLYISSLLVFALDRYYVGVETVFWVLSVYLMAESMERVRGIGKIFYRFSWPGGGRLD